MLLSTPAALPPPPLCAIRASVRPATLSGPRRFLSAPDALLAPALHHPRLCATPPPSCPSSGFLRTPAVLPDPPYARRRVVPRAGDVVKCDFPRKCRTSLRHKAPIAYNGPTSKAPASAEKSCDLADSAPLSLATSDCFDCINCR
ncbi:hypothetical protein K439DRAFT_1619388 [Ramaria rubella]|nr:hypothetical protein K439DRAFT_1619388 [Ramaria rubella]